MIVIRGIKPRGYYTIPPSHNKIKCTDGVLSRGQGDNEYSL